jgi:hypothetical protein
MNHLTEEGKALYKAYINAKKTWFNYIKDIAYNEYQTILHLLQKHYLVNEYIYFNKNME